MSEALIDAISNLRAELDKTQQELNRLRQEDALVRERFNEFIAERNGEKLHWADVNSTIRLENERLAKALARLGKDVIEAQESRDTIREHAKAALDKYRAQKDAIRAFLEAWDASIPIEAQIDLLRKLAE